VLPHAVNPQSCEPPARPGRTARRQQSQTNRSASRWSHCGPDSS